jgi:hypothetical protein
MITLSRFVKNTLAALQAEEQRIARDKAATEARVLAEFNRLKAKFDERST